MLEPKRVSRRSDVDPASGLHLTRTEDGDLSVALGFGESVVFCAPSRGGGKSPHTWRALIRLFEAMRKDEDQEVRHGIYVYNDAVDTLIGGPGLPFSINSGEQLRQELLADCRL
jgi:hypothetical protein